MKGGSVVGVVATAGGVRRQRRLEDRGAATACRAWLVDNTGGSGRMPDRVEVRCYAGSRAGDPFSIPRNGSNRDPISLRALETGSTRATRRYLQHPNYQHFSWSGR